MEAATVAIAAAAATAAATSFSSPSLEAGSAGLGPRFTGVGVVLPTIFFGLEVLVAADLEAGVLEASFEGVGLLSCVLGRVGVFVSVVLLAGGFLVVVSDLEADLGVSGLVDFVAEAGRVRGDAAGFLAAGVVGLVASFFMGVVVLDACDAGGLPPEGVVDVVLEAAGLGVVEEVLGVVGLAVVVELLAVLAVGGRVEAEAGRDAAVPVVGLVVLETGLSVLGEAAELGLVRAAEAGLGAVGLLAAAAVLLVLTSLAAADDVFFVAVVPLADFTPLVVAEAGRAVPAGFFSPTLAEVLEAGAPAVPVGFLEAAEVGVLFLSGVAEVFLATPLVWGLDTPLVRRFWAVLGRALDAVLVWPALPGFVLAAALLVVLALGSAAGLPLVLAGGVSLVGSGWGSPWPISPTDCCPITSSAGLAAWLASSPTGGAASFTGLDSNVSIGSNAAVATPSGFISP